MNFDSQNLPREIYILHDKSYNKGTAWIILLDKVSGDFSLATFIPLNLCLRDQLPLCLI